MILKGGIYNTFLTGLQIPITGGTFAAVGYDITGGGNKHVLYSTDGISWTETVGGAPLNLNVRYGSDRFVAVGKSNNSYSFDGISWTGVSRANTINYYDAVYAPSLSLWCSVGANISNTNSVQTSTNGESWTARNASASYAWFGLDWSESLGTFVAVGSTDGAVGGSCIMTSTNGTSWTTRTPAAGCNRLWDVVWSEEKGIFCAVGDAGTTRVMCSTDGINWTGGTAAQSNEWTAVDYSPELGLFVAVSNNGSNRAMRSTDGFNWTASTINSGVFSYIWNDIVWAGNGVNLFVAVAINQTSVKFATSEDGITFTNRTAGGDTELKGIAFKPKTEL